MGSLLQQIAKNKAELKAQGIHQEIPLEGPISKHIEVPAQPVQPVIKRPEPNIQPAKKPGLSLKLPQKQVVTEAPSGAAPGVVAVVQPKAMPVQQTPQGLVITQKVAPHVERQQIQHIQTPQPAQTQSNSPITQTQLTVELDTFNSGIEKYSEQEVQEIKSSLEFLRTSFDQPEIISDALKTIMLDLKTNPALMGIITFEDIGTMVKAMRESYGVHIAKAETRKAGGAGSRGGRKKAGELDINLDLGQLMGGLKI